MLKKKAIGTSKKRGNWTGEESCEWELLFGILPPLTCPGLWLHKEEGGEILFDLQEEKKRDASS
jgi:hypothetical protein